MKNFRLNGRLIEVSKCDNKIVAKFEAQSVSFACQGSWSNYSVTIPVNKYSESLAKLKIIKGMDIKYYKW